MKKFILILFILIIPKVCVFAVDVPQSKDVSLSVLVDEINSLKDDRQKIEKWAKYNSKNFLIIDKRVCSAIICDKEGREIKTFEVGIGREIGDDFNDTSGLMGKSKNTTPAGEFTLIPNVYNTSAYGELTLSLGSKASKVKDTKKVVAMHKIPKFRMKDRISKFYDGDIKNNRMSHGCINFLEDDFQELKKYVKGGDKVYVLPEEDNNGLALTQKDNGEFEFRQTKY